MNNILLTIPMVMPAEGLSIQEIPFLSGLIRGAASVAVGILVFVAIVHFIKKSPSLYDGSSSWKTMIVPVAVAIVAGVCIYVVLNLSSVINLFTPVADSILDEGNINPLIPGK